MRKGRKMSLGKVSEESKISAIFIFFVKIKNPALRK
jgi:hypothetical protein